MRFAFKSVNFEESRWQVTLHYMRGPHPRGCVKEVTWQEWGGQRKRLGEQAPQGRVATPVTGLRMT